MAESSEAVVAEAAAKHDNEEKREAELEAGEPKFKWDDVGEQNRFAIVSLCACDLSELYTVGRNQSWSDGYLASLVKTVGLPKRVETNIRKIIAGHMGLDRQFYIEMINEDQRYSKHPQLLIHDLLLASMEQGSYDARCRAFLKRLSSTLAFDADTMTVMEETALSWLRALHECETEEVKAAREAEKKKQRRKKAVLIGVSAVIGATVIGVTGGLAAPFVAAGAGLLIGGGSAAILGSAVGVALITTIFTGAGAGFAGYKMKKRLGDVKEFEIRTVGEKRPSLRSVIAVTGWLPGEDLEKDVADFTAQWACLDEGDEVYGVRWESEELHELGSALSKFLTETAVSYVVTETLKQTIIKSLLSAIAWPVTLLQLASVIDNPWQICLNRAEDAGRLLADALRTSKDARRPVTLIGYSMGARLIFYALQELAKYKDSAGIVENVYLLGAPITAKPAHFKTLLADVIAGDCVVAYSRSDWVLKFLHRTATASTSVAGVSPIELDHPRLINIDLSKLVTRHHDYVTKLPRVLSAVGVRVDADSWTMADADADDSPPSPVPAADGVIDMDDEVPPPPDKTAPSEQRVEGVAVAAAVEAQGASIAPLSTNNESSSSSWHPTSSVKLSSGHSLPMLGFGTYSATLTHPQLKDVVVEALHQGYRHFDCAPIYGTQSTLGEVFNDLQSAVPSVHRRDLFITSKLWNTLHHPSHVRQSCLDCIDALQCDYLDLFLIHSPCAMKFTGYGVGMENRIPVDDAGNAILDTQTQHIDTWKAMEQLVDEGLVRSIGVSNFNRSHLEALLPQCRIRPAVNQIEVHPYCAQPTLVEWCQSQGIHVTAFSPLGSQTGIVDVLGDTTIVEMASMVGVSPAQLCLRWAVQRGISVVPHSAQVQFLTENKAIFNFTLTSDQMQVLSILDEEKRTLVFDWLSWE
ncbi:transmembrane and coiled-coil domain-containing protein 4-like [Sycon ciliatum]|uniref:transmembrane and coiled-coil domain-containing protein 4-like n=1 Tax=Sycon ciliatum TaxID=27933 RepID=UPI0031F62281